MLQHNNNNNNKLDSGDSEDKNFLKSETTLAALSASRRACTLFFAMRIILVNVQRLYTEQLPYLGAQFNLTCTHPVTKFIQRAVQQCWGSVGV